MGVIHRTCWSAWIAMNLGERALGLRICFRILGKWEQLEARNEFDGVTVAVCCIVG